MSGGTAHLPPPAPRSAPSRVAAPRTEVVDTALAGPLTRGTGERDTPTALRRLSVVVALACTVLAVAGWYDATTRTETTRTIREATGPVLVATQNLRASLAEADAAQTDAFFAATETGTEDVRARRSYEDALGRATSQIEDISALIGDDAATHEVLKDVAALVTRYAGLVEAARASRVFDAEASRAFLEDAVDVLDVEISAEVARVAGTAQVRLEDDAAAQSVPPLTGVIAGLLAVAAIAWSSIDLARRTRRLLNPGLVIALLASIGAVAWLVAATTTATTRFERAVADGYDSIAATAQLQEAGFGAKTEQTLRELRGTSSAGDMVAVESTLDEIVRLADSDREAALALETATRWQRWQQAPGPSAQSTSAFNGFVFAVEGVLADNRDQFLAGLDGSSTAMRGLRLGMIGLPLLAAAAALAGFQRRIDEYR